MTNYCVHYCIQYNVDGIKLFFYSDREENWIMNVFYQIAGKFDELKSIRCHVVA